MMDWMEEQKCFELKLRKEIQSRLTDAWLTWKVLAYLQIGWWLSIFIVVEQGLLEK